MFHQNDFSFTFTFRIDWQRLRVFQLTESSLNFSLQPLFKATENIEHFRHFFSHSNYPLQYAFCSHSRRIATARYNSDFHQIFTSIFHGYFVKHRNMVWSSKKLLYHTNIHINKKSQTQFLQLPSCIKRTFSEMYLKQPGTQLQNFKEEDTEILNFLD